MRQSTKFKPAALETQMDCAEKESKAPSSPLLNWDRLIYPKLPEPVMALAAPKESKAQLRVPDLETALRSRVRVTAAGTPRECRHLASRRSRLQPTRLNAIWMKTWGTRSRLKSFLSQRRSTPMRPVS